MYSYGESRKPVSRIHEDLCRDRPLSDSQQRLRSHDIDAQPGGRNADDKRADIRATSDMSNVPVEIKKSVHPKLWKSLRDQLIAKHTRDPGADGIYLVLWFGEERVPPSPSGMRPKCAPA